MRASFLRALAAVGGLAFAWPTASEVLPVDRGDLLYHSYDGGGVQIQGPSLLVRKQAGKSFSFFGNYYIDYVSSASIDVVTTASPYKEERHQYSLGFNYLYGKTMMSLGYTNSEENDYTGNAAAFSVSQEIFGGLTTVTLGYARGWDEVRRNGDPSFQESVDRQNYAIGLSQVVTKNLLLAINFETITDEGFLNNPYRSVRYVDPNSATGFSFEPEVYPRTRTSNSAAIRSNYYLPFRASVHAEYRYFTDTWEVEAHTAGVGYTHTVGDTWIVDLRYRYYAQDGAVFYRDLFPRSQFLNFRARDKELSTFTSNTLGLGLTYTVFDKPWMVFDRGSATLQWDHILFDYADFRDITQGGQPGTEPLYNFSADVIQLYFSVWF